MQKNEALAPKYDNQIAEHYYDSNDADTFYETIWGGEDIHIGLYDNGDTVYQASRKTVEAMANLLGEVDSATRIIDLGAGYGGSARYLNERFGCHVTCVNISEVQNNRNRQLNLSQNQQDKIDVLHGDFESIPVNDQAFDIAWSQDSFLHSNNRNTVLNEIHRVLKPGGILIFTDPMQIDNCPVGVLQPVYDRLNLQSLASIEFYRQQLSELGFKELNFFDHSSQLRNHYARIKNELAERSDEIKQHVNEEYINSMLTGLGRWVDAADQGFLKWGIAVFKKES